MTEHPPHRVVVIGGDFGGLQVVHGLRRVNVEVTLIDRRNVHTFQPFSRPRGPGS
jgi:NADH dehydrogenase